MLGLRRRNLMKTKSALQTVLNIFSIIFSSSTVFTIILLAYNYCTEDPICILDFFLQDAEIYLGNSFETFQNIYLTIFTCVLGIYFTVLGIVLSNKNISFKDFYFFTISYQFIWNLIILIMNFVLFLIILPLHKYTVSIEIFYITNIFQIICFAVISISEMSYLQNFEDTISALTRKTEKMVKRGSKQFVSLITNFVKNSFPEKEPFEIYDRILSSINPDLYEKTLDEVILNYPALMNVSAERYPDVLHFIIKNIYSTIKNGDNVNYDLLEKEIQFYFDTYRKFCFSKTIETSYLLNIREPLFSIILIKKENCSQKLIETYFKILNGSKQIILISLHQLNYKIVNLELNDFIYFIQFFDLYDISKSVIQLYYSNIIDIITHITNLLILKRLDNNFIDLIVQLYSKIKELVIYDISSELYTELLPDINAHFVKYDRNFFICEALIILRIYDEKLFNTVFEMITYYKKNNSKYLEYIHFDLLHRAVLSIEKKDYILNDKITELEFENALNELESKLNNKIKGIKEKNLNITKNQITEELINERLAEEETKLRKDLEQFNILEKLSDTKNLRIESNYCFSVRQILKDSSIMSFGQNYFNLFIPLLYNAYLQMSNISIININNIEAIDNYITGKIIKLFVPISMHSYFYTKNIPGINFKQNGFILNGVTYELQYFHSQMDLIVLADDLLNNIAVKDITNNKDKISKEDANDIYDVNINLPFTIEFAFEAKKNLRAFRLIK